MQNHLKLHVAKSASIVYKTSNLLSIYLEWKEYVMVRGLGTANNHCVVFFFYQKYFLYIYIVVRVYYMCIFGWVCYMNQIITNA